MAKEKNAPVESILEDAKKALNESQKTLNDLRVLMRIANTEKRQDLFMTFQQSIAHHFQLLTDQVQASKATRIALAEAYLAIKAKDPQDPRLAQMKLMSDSLQNIPKQIAHLANIAKKRLLPHAPKVIHNNPTRELLKSAPKAPTIDPAIAMMKDAPKASKSKPEYDERILSIVEKKTGRERRLAYKEAVEGMNTHEMLEFNRALRQELVTQKNQNTNRPRR